MGPKIGVDQNLLRLYFLLEVFIDASDCVEAGNECVTRAQQERTRHAAVNKFQTLLSHASIVDRTSTKAVVTWYLFSHRPSNDVFIEN